MEAVWLLQSSYLFSGTKGVDTAEQLATLMQDAARFIHRKYGSLPAQDIRMKHYYRDNRIYLEIIVRDKS